MFAVYFFSQKSKMKREKKQQLLARKETVAVLFSNVLSARLATYLFHTICKVYNPLPLDRSGFCALVHCLGVDLINY